MLMQLSSTTKVILVAEAWLRSRPILLQKRLPSKVEDYSFFG
jgi:hypothetical protein